MPNWIQRFFASFSHERKMPAIVTEESDPNQVLQRLFNSHEVSARLVDGVVLLDKEFGASASFWPEQVNLGTCSVRLDVHFALSPERIITESCVGIGSTVETSRRNAWEAFKQQSFHVLLAAFFGRGVDQVTQEERSINGHLMMATDGGATIRSSGHPPEQLLVANALWHQTLIRYVEHSKLDCRIHWVRIYYASLPQQRPVVEALLDNETWQGLQDELMSLQWPVSDAFYSLRMFQVIQPLETNQGSTTT